MPFEYAVRPFQSRDAHGRTLLPSTPSASTQRATLTWGSKAAGAALPKPATVGYNMNCCTANHQQVGSEKAEVYIPLEGPMAGTDWFKVNRSDVMLAQKEDKDDCGGGLLDDSYVASGVRQAFSEMNALIHASDGAFLPTGSKGCKAKTTLKNG